MVLLACGGKAGAVSVETGDLTVRFSADGELILWRACINAAERAGDQPLCMDFVDGAVASDVRPRPSGAAPDASRARVWKEQYPNGSRVFVELPLGSNGTLIREYLFPDQGYRSTVREYYHGSAENGIPRFTLKTSASFRPQPMPGFSSGYAAVRSVLVADGREHRLDAEDDWPAHLAGGEWLGFRTRFWAKLITPVDAGSLAIVAPPAPAGASLEVMSAPGDSRLEFHLYTGPVEPGVLEQAGDGLDSLLYSQLWSWIRPLSHGLRWILDAIQSFVGNVGLSIMILSVVVKFLMWPLTRLAERWQADVDRQHATIQPVLDEIKAAYRGEERHDRTLAAYREHGISPLYAARSLFGYLVQIPVFIAAFAMLGENIGLAAESWLWIRDLSRPDALFALPIAIPFFGQDLNLLPLLMTAITVLSAAIHTDRNLPPGLLAARRRQLYFLAALFLVLFYTFPAAMVLYWTTNNLLHLLTMVAGRIRTSA